VIPVEVQRLHKSGGVPGLGELLTAVKAILESCDVAFVVIDAMDESSPRIDLLKVIRDLATDSRFSKVQILATSREYVDIERTMEDISSSVPMSNPLVEEDIRVHVRSKLHLNDKFRRWPEDLLSDVEEAVATGAKGMYVLESVLFLGNLFLTLSRFRWAVCQLDVLQRLKCERHIVRNALATLPKTLDETYERVFLCIPREEWPFVHHALQWIHYHNELYHGEGIPCSTLLNAIQRSIDPLDERYDDQFYDVDRLRELCGCLIHVTAEDPSHTGTLKTVVGISFAHYTVREYLDSARILTGPTASFAISTRAIKQQFTEIALREAKNFQLPDEWTSDTFLLHESKVHDRLYGDLALYCLASALVSITIWQEEICQLNRLFDLVKEFLDPTKPHFDDLCTATNIISIFTLLFLDAEWYDEFQFCNISWQPAPNKADDVILLNLFLMSGFSVSSLAKKFLEEGDVKNLVSSRLTFTKSVWNVLSEGDAEVYSFNGSIIEVMAQCAFRNPGNFKLLLNNSTGLYDPSDILVSFIGSHGDCFPSYGLLEHILQAGADPNVKGYRVTPLQMATVSWDYIGVRMLLEAGADPNCIGDKDGVQWEAKALLGRFNFLHGLTPLYIHRNLGCILKDRRQDARASEARGIASLLLQYGARAYREQ
jgi:hypothetical protein